MDSMERSIKITLLGKKGYSIALRTGPSTKECTRIKESIEHFYGHLEIKPMVSLGGEKMQKVMVIGCPGSGKSTFSRALQEITGLPLFHLDMLYWNADKTSVPESVFRERINNTIIKDRWIIDGNYGSTIDLRLQRCDTVFFLDYQTEVCLNGIVDRKGKIRTDMPWVESTEEEDEDFVSFIKEFNTVSRPKVIDLLSDYSDKNIIIFKNRDEANRYLNRMK